MSWDAYLVDDRGHTEGDWNYTHNMNRMIAEALFSLGCENAFEIGSNHPVAKMVGPPWWERLDGCDGPTGAKFLHELIGALDSDPEKYRAMNPSNGWGDYDSLIGVLSEMRNAVPEWPTTWRVSG